jgi:hypothetical protein
MTIDSHLAIEHNVWRFDQAAGMKASATYGSATSDQRLHDLHVILHEAKGEMVALEHGYAFAG